MRKQWKRTMRRIIACVLIVALVLPNTVVAAPKPEINKKSIILCKKEKYQLKISHQRKMQIPLHRITDSASNGSVFPVVTEHFSASSDHAFL